MPKIGGLDIPDNLMPGAPVQAQPSFGQILKASAKNVVDVAATALPLQFETLTRDKVDPVYQAQAADKLRQASDEAAKAAPSGLDDWRAGRVGLRKFITDNIAASLPQMGATLAGSVVGGAVGGVPGALAGGMAVDAPLFSSQNVARAVQENGKLDVGAAERSAAISIPQAASDVMEERFFPGAEKFLGKLAATQTGGFLRRVAVSAAKAGGQEAITEAAQQMGERESAGLPLTGTDAAGEYVNAAVTAFAMGGAIGAFGGLRRHPADVKPANEVTTEDLTDKLNTVLRLPAPADLIAGADGQTRVNPSGSNQLALPSPEMVRNQHGIPDVVVDAAGRAAPLEQTIPTLPTPKAPDGSVTVGEAPAALAAQPRTEDMRTGGATLELGDVPNSHPGNFTPEVANALASATPPAPNSPLASTHLASQQVTGFDGAPAIQLPDNAFRPFKDDKVEDIHAAVKDKKSAEHLVAAANDELDSRHSEAAGATPLTADFSQRLADVKHGIRGSWVMKLDATDPADLVDKVYKRVFEDQDTAKSVTTLAQRLGILDENLQPGPMAKKLEAQGGAAANPLYTGETPHSVMLDMGLASNPRAAAYTSEIEVPIADLKSGQTEIDTGGRTKAPLFDRGLSAIRSGGEYHLTDGNHRVAEALARGDKTVKVVVTDMDAFRAAHPDVAAQVAAAGGLEARPAAESSQGVRGTDAAGGETGGFSTESPAPPAAPSVNTAVGSPEDTAAAQKSWKGTLKQAGVNQPARVDGTPTASAGRLFQLAPTSEADARAKVFRLLANDGDIGDKGVSQTEKVAQHLGLITNDEARDITPLGRRTFLGTPEGLQETHSVASRLGHTGANASAFERGMRTHLGADPQTEFADSTQAAAHEAGHVWARNFIDHGQIAHNVNWTSAAESENTLSTLAKKGRRTYDERHGERPQLSDAQIEQASANRLIDAADLRTAPDEDVAALRRMAREGASAEDVGRAIQNVQAGRTLFEEGPVQPYQAAPQRLVRGQPQFVEMNTRDPVSKANNRAETEGAVKAADLRNLVRFALAEKGITAKKAEKLHALLDAGKVDQVAKLLKDFMPDAGAAFGERRGDPRSGDYMGYADHSFQQSIEGKDFHGALQTLVEDAPSAYHRALMRGVQALANKLKAGGTDFNLHIIKPGDTVPGPMLEDPSTRAYTTMRKVPPRVDIYLKGVEFGHDAGMNYQVLAHEMVHGTTLMLTNFYRGRALGANDHLGQAVRNLEALAEHVIEHFHQRMEAGQLNEFEKRFYEHQNNSMIDADEILTWGLTNPDMQRYLSSIQYKPRQSVFGKLVDLLRRVIGTGHEGVTVDNDSALAELLRVSERITNSSQAELNSVFMRNRFEGRPAGAVYAAMNDAGASAANRTVAASTDVLKGLSKLTDEMVDKINPTDMKRSARKMALGWMSHNQIGRLYAHLMPAINDHAAAHNERVAVNSRFQQMGMTTLQGFEKLKNTNPKAAGWVNELMALTTKERIDPNKAFDKHTHLGWATDDAGNAVVEKGREADVARSRAAYEKVQQLKNNLSRGDGEGWKVFNDFRAYNETQNFARMAASLHSMVALDRELRLGVADSDVNPVDAFMRQQNINDNATARTWWQNKLAQQIAQTIAFVNAKRGEIEKSGDESAIAGMDQHLAPIELEIGALHKAMAAMQQSPYFHLGRFGDHFGSASVRKLEDGRADPKALEKLAEVLHAHKFDRFAINADDTKAHFMMRFETADQAVQFRQIMQGLEKDGWLTEDTIKAGPRDRSSNFGMPPGAMPAYVQAYIANIENSPQYAPTDDMDAKARDALAKRRDQAVQIAMDTWIEQQPDSSIAKVLTKRYDVSGHENDMVRSFVHRARVGAISLSNVSAAPKFNQAFESMRGEVEAAVAGQAPENEKPKDPWLLSDLMNEMRRRDAVDPVNAGADSFDKLRAIGHAYYLGLSPAYGIVNLSQLMVTGLPELGKKFSYRDSFSAMRRGGGTAMKIMSALAQESASLGWRHGADVAITDHVLKKAGISVQDAAFIHNMVALGTIDIGSAARAFGQVANGTGGGNLDVALKYSSMIGLYTETYTRLTMALAAAELHGDKPGREDYAAKTVSESMFDYQNWNTARQLGKQGFAGRLTPLFTQFMSYTVQVTEKLYSESINAIGKARPGETAEATAQRAKEARRFLAGHLTAVTALAGTLGLPLASVFASALERVVGNDDQPWDATTAYRDFLAHVFGKDAGEVISRGLPRALGFDISQRTGEQDILPFSKLINDKRTWGQAVSDYLGHSIGASGNMLVNVLDGGAEIAKGDIVQGSVKMAPIAMQSLLKTYQMTQDGYVDSKGNKMPMTPGARDMMWQLMGFTPAEKAEYSEARNDLTTRKGQLARQAAELRTHVVDSMLKGDTTGATAAVQRAQAFDAANPSFAVLPSIKGALTSQLQNRAQAAALGTPIGVSMKDIAGQNMTKYANVRYTAQ